jgi:hypothetical protein
MSNRTATYSLKSSNRKSDESISTVVYNIPITKKNYTDLKIHGFTMRNSVYNVNQYNNTFLMTYSGTTYTISINVGYYTSITTLLSALKIKLDACGAGLTFTCAADPVTYNVTISTTNNFILTFNHVPTQFLLGFVSATNYTGAATYTGSQFYDLVYTDYINIYIKEIGFTLEIPVVTQIGYLIDYSNSWLNMINSPIYISGALTVELKDQYGQLIDTETDNILRIEIN